MVINIRKSRIWMSLVGVVAAFAMFGTQADAASKPQAGQYCSKVNATAKLPDKTVLKCVPSKSKHWVIVTPPPAKTVRVTATTTATVTAAESPAQTVTATETKTLPVVTKTVTEMPLWFGIRDVCSASNSGGYIRVTYGFEEYTNKAWTFHQDDGTLLLQGRDDADRVYDLKTAYSGGEGVYWYYANSGTVHPRLVRLKAKDGVVSEWAVAIGVPACKA